MQEKEAIFEQTYTPDWANIPAEFNWVAVDSDGEVCAYEAKPSAANLAWVSDDGSVIHIGFIKEPHDDHFKTMIYERPKPAAP